MARKEPVVLDLPFDSCVNRRTCGKLVSAVIKYVVYQRHQIPCQYDLLQRIVATAADNQSDSESEAQNDHDGLDFNAECEESFEIDVLKRRKAVRQKLKEKRLRKQEAKKHAKYVKKAEKALHLLESLLQPTEDAFNHPSSVNISEVVLMLGATTMSPKEVYHIVLPETSDIVEESDGIPLRRVLLNLFRHVVSSEDFQHAIGSRLALTNFRVYLHVRDGRSIVDGDLLLPQPDFHVTERGQHIFFNVSHDVSWQKQTLFAGVTPIPVKQARMEAWSGAKKSFLTPGNSTKFDADMSLCTPFMSKPQVEWCEFMSTVSEGEQGLDVDESLMKHFGTVDEQCVPAEDCFTNVGECIFQSTPFRGENVEKLASKADSLRVSEEAIEESCNWFEVPVVFKGFTDL